MREIIVGVIFDVFWKDCRNFKVGREFSFYVVRYFFVKFFSFILDIGG